MGEALDEVIKKLCEYENPPIKAYDDRLKPCRFCKRKQAMTWHIAHYDKPWVVECCCCQAQGPHADTEKEAIEFWNEGVNE